MNDSIRERAEALLSRLDDALDATLADLEQGAPLDVGSSAVTANVLYRYGELIADPAALAHVRRRLSAADAHGDSETPDRLRVIAQSIEAAQAMSAEELASIVEATETFRATMDALNTYVHAVSMEAAYEFLKQRSDLLATDLAVELIAGKVGEMRAAGAVEAAQSLARGPLRLVRDVREHGLDQGYRVFLDRDRQQEDAQARLGALVSTVPPELIDAVDAVLGTGTTPALAGALEHGYAWLVRPEAAQIMRESATIIRAGGTSDEEAARLASLAALVERLSVVALDDPQLPVYEAVRWALAEFSGDS